MLYSDVVVISKLCKRVIFLGMTPPPESFGIDARFLVTLCSGCTDGLFCLKHEIVFIFHSAYICVSMRFFFCFGKIIHYLSSSWQKYDLKHGALFKALSVCHISYQGSRDTNICQVLSSG